MNKFKVGDPVKALVSTPWWREGDVGVIVPNPDGGFKVAFKDGGTWWFCDDEESMFELVEPKVHITSGGGSGGNWGAFCVPVAACPNPPHIHEDSIIAWANGADIEVSSGDGVFYETFTPQHRNFSPGPECWYKTS